MPNKNVVAEIKKFVDIPTIGVVTIPKLEEMASPWKDQDIFSGSSPFRTMQETWAKSPSFITSDPNVIGCISGASAGKGK